MYRDMDIRRAATTFRATGITSTSRLVVYSRKMEPGKWIGKSLLRPSYTHWLLKDEFLRIEAVAARRNGVGVPVATAAEGATQG